jgi:hypothetical protein
MLRYKCHVADSKIPQAGKGLFIDESVECGQILIYPNQKNQTITEAEFETLAADSMELQSSIRWFEDLYTVDLEWSLECYLNHSFSPNCLWHLGFVFALRDLNPGDELTIDYRVLLQAGSQLEYIDSITQKPIIGMQWREKMQFTSRHLVELLK